MAEIEKSFQYTFNSVDIDNYNKFNMSFSNKFTASSGLLYPILLQENIPADINELAINHHVRTQPMLSPAMQDLQIDFHVFAAPYRLIDCFREVISQGDGALYKNKEDSYIKAQKTAKLMPYTYLPQILQLLVSTVVEHNHPTQNSMPIDKDFDWYQVFDGLDFHGIPIHQFCQRNDVINGEELKEYLGQYFDEMYPSWNPKNYYFKPVYAASGRNFDGTPNILIAYYMSLLDVDTFLDYISYCPPEEAATRLIRGKEFYKVGSTNTQYRNLNNKFALPNNNIFDVHYMGANTPAVLAVTDLSSEDWFTKLFGFISSAQVNAFNYLGDESNFSSWEPMGLAPFIMTYLVYKDWFRDQNFIPEWSVQQYDGFQYFYKYNEMHSLYFLNHTNLPIVFSLKHSAYQRDYFQACLPAPQLGSETFVPLSKLGGNEIFYNRTNFHVGANEYVNNGVAKYYTQESPQGEDPMLQYILNSRQTQHLETPSIANPPNPSFAITVNSIRAGFACQEYLELVAATGTRYPELMYGEYGVSVPDAVVDRPIYLNHFKDVIKISDVESNSVTLDSNNDVVSPIAQLGGKGIAFGQNNFTKFEFQEFGFLIVFMRIIPKTAYFQGLHKKFHRLDTFDFYHSKFANLGEMAVNHNEIYFDGAYGDRQKPFGYLPNYSEYRSNNDEIHGELVSSLNQWVAVRKFNARPQLGQYFAEVHPEDIAHIFSISDTRLHPFICDVYFDYTKLSRMSIYDVPSGLS